MLVIINPMSQTCDYIYTVSDYHDGIRHGVTTLHGQPHVYQSLWTDHADECDTFVLQAIDEETFQLALEDWAIWLRWDTAFAAGQTTRDTHPAVASDRLRHEALEAVLTSRLTINAQHALRAILVNLPCPETALPRRWDPRPVQWICLEPARSHQE